MTSTTKPGLVELLCSFDLTLGLARRLLKLRLESTAAGTDRSHETFQESTALPLLMLCLDSLGFIVAQQRLQASSSSASRGELQGLGLRQDHQILPVFHVYLQQLYIRPDAVLAVDPTVAPALAVPQRRLSARKIAEESLQALHQTLNGLDSLPSPSRAVDELLSQSENQQHPPSFAAFSTSFARALVNSAKSPAASQDPDRHLQSVVSAMLKHHLYVSPSVPDLSGAGETADAPLPKQQGAVTETKEDSSDSARRVRQAGAGRLISTTSSDSQSSGHLSIRSYPDRTSSLGTKPDFETSHTVENTADPSVLNHPEPMHSRSASQDSESNSAVLPMVGRNTKSSPRGDDAASTIAPSIRSTKSYSSGAALLRPASLQLTRTSDMDHAAPSGKHSSLEFSRSAAPFADALVPRLQRSASEAVKLPPTTNELSREERRHFVKRSKKLQNMLGATLNEDATEKTLLSSMSKMRLLQSLELDEHDGSHTLRHKRSMSYPPPSPTASSHLANSNSNSSRQNIYDSHQASASAYDFGLSPFSDSTASRASSSAGFNPTSPGTEFSPLTPYDLATGSDHWDKPGAYGTRDSIREARRRRVRKLHAMLGEQVPLEVILEYEHKNAIGNNRSLQSSPDLSSQPDRKHARNPSRFGQAIARLTGSGKKREQTASNENQSSSDDEEQWTGPPSPVDISSWPSDAPFTARDKKLVALFGALPPSDLRSSSHPQSERHSLDQLSILDPDSPASSPELNVSMARRQSIGSTCSRASLRRRSLATLQWLAENDPQRLAQKLQALYSDQSGALAPHKEEEKLDDEEEAEHLTDDDEPSSEDPLGRLSLADVTQKSGSHVTANASGSAITSNDPQTRSRGYSSPQMPHAGRASLDQNRSLQQAVKLTKVLGSEVLSRVLEDIADDMLEDPEAGEEDRRALRKLRETLV